MRRGITTAYHCTSRTVAGQYLFGRAERECFHRRLYRLARFLQVKIHSFTILSNHFHLIVRVPARVGQHTDLQLLRALKRFYGPKHPHTVNLAQALRNPESGLLAKLRAQHRARMGDLSVFMKELKEWFSKWFNHRHERFGPLWAERFWSKLVEGAPWPLMLVAAYIDLNGVRAGLADKPEHYRWCSYAEALVRDGPARQGLAAILPGRSWPEKLADYQRLLFGLQHPDAPALDPEGILATLREQGTVTVPQLLRLKVRYFTEGLVLGTEAYVQEVFEQLWKPHCKQNRPACWPLAGADWGGLVTLRKLKEAIGLPKRFPPE